ncbi:uncharacterized protein LOC123685288 [Harmonia axyridis]|uniref:uncharacterized protein LOC123685288 n=1 Tax=Harmonia axyridis TaxID=115357 RepID=UPI001E279350|nr:uncharacterized protein LOC123685288 [Harmonia axyridis]
MNYEISKVANTRHIIILGDLNSRTGRRHNDDIVGPYGGDVTNDNGTRLITLCDQNKLKITNGFFQHKDIHKYTRKQKTRNLRSIIDYAIIRQKSSLDIQDVKVYRSATCGSDHHLFRVGIRRQHGKKHQVESIRTAEEKRYYLMSLEQESAKKLYKQRLDEKLGHAHHNNPEDLYHHIKENIHAAAKEALGFVENNAKPTPYWWDEEIEDEIKIKRKKYRQYLNTKRQRDWTKKRAEFEIEDSSQYVRVQASPIRISRKEVKDICLSLRNGRSPRPGGIPAELIKNGTEKLYEELKTLFQYCISGQDIPKEFGTSFISTIYKSGNKNDCNIYRGIAVMSTISRIYGRILKNRIEREYSDLEAEEQAGFRAGRSITDHLFCLTQIIEKKVAVNQELHILYVDLKKAYDSIP